MISVVCGVEENTHHQGLSNVRLLSKEELRLGSIVAETLNILDELNELNGERLLCTQSSDKLQGAS